MCSMTKGGSASCLQGAGSASLTLKRRSGKILTQYIASSWRGLVTKGLVLGGGGHLRRSPGTKPSSQAVALPPGSPPTLASALRVTWVAKPCRR